LGEICLLHLQGERRRKAKNKRESRWQRALDFLLVFLIGLFVDCEDGDHKLSRNVKFVSKLFGVITRKNLPVIITDVRI
jgi:hypothetical protein